VWDVGWGGQQPHGQDHLWRELARFSLVTRAMGVSAGEVADPQTLSGEPHAGCAVDRWVSFQVVSKDSQLHAQ